MFDELLKKFNISRESLTMAELETLEEWAKGLSTKQLNVPAVADYVETMIDSINRELHGYDTPRSFVALLFRRRQHRHLEARLMNYILLRDFLTAPDKAKKYVEEQLKQIAK